MNLIVSQSLGITLTNNKMKDVLKLINYSENRGILLKKTAKKLLATKDNYSIFSVL